MSVGAAADTIWVSPSEQENDAASFDDSPDNFYDDDDDDNNYQSDFMDENAAPSASNVARNKLGDGLSIQVEGGLLEAPRKVNKLDIG